MKKTFTSVLILAALSVNAQIINTAAGNGISGYSGDGGPATAAEFNAPEYIAIDVNNNIYITDDLNQVIRVINTSGIISTFAGNGAQGYSGDGGLATAAELNLPFGLAFDASSNMYIGDTYNNAIRQVNTSGVISTVAGNGVNGYSGDGGLATAAELSTPMGVTLDKNGNMFIADNGNNVIREVNTSGIISTVVGTGQPGYFGDGGLATIAELQSPTAMAFDAAGNMYISDEINRIVRKVDNAGYIHPFAGKGGVIGYTGDGGPATSAEIFAPFGVTFDVTGNLYIPDGNGAIRMVDPSNTIYTFAGQATAGYSGDGGPATAAELSNPTCVAIGAGGNMYIADQANEVIRVINGVPTGIAQLNRETDAISIYPNPSNGLFNLSITNYELKMNNYLEVYNVLGEKISEDVIRNSQFVIDLSNRTSGIYLYRIITETGNLVSIGKLIIEK